MIIERYCYSGSWSKPFNTELDSENTLILVFGCNKIKLVLSPLDEISNSFPRSIITGSSTAGEIYQDQLIDNSLVVMVIKFEKTRVRIASEYLDSIDNSFESGVKVAFDLFDSTMKAMFVISDGLNVNGSKLSQGINSIVTDKAVVTGGLAGDQDRFESSWVLVDGKPKSNYVTAVAFYGEEFHIGYGSKGGWDRLGIERKVTRSKGSVLYELDGQPALELYKKYLGDKADELPASGLLFPLEVREENVSHEGKVRTILAVDEKAQSITFAGDIVEGSYATLMKANFDRLVDGAIQAAEMCESTEEHQMLSIAISCVGRRLVLKQRTEEELDAILDVFPEKTEQIGFYSYGEISPLQSGLCDLYNQTMTLTTIWEQ